LKKEEEKIFPKLRASKERGILLASGCLTKTSGSKPPRKRGIHHRSHFIKRRRKKRGGPKRPKRRIRADCNGFGPDREKKKRKEQAAIDYLFNRGRGEGSPFLQAQLCFHPKIQKRVVKGKGRKKRGRSTIYRRGDKKRRNFEVCWVRRFIERLKKRSRSAMLREGEKKKVTFLLAREEKEGEKKKRSALLTAHS